MGDQLYDLVQRYLELHRQYGHTPRRRGTAGSTLPTFVNAQRELWALAQAICTLTHPKIQAELDAARRDAVAQIRLHIEHASPVEVRPRPRQRPIMWSDFQLTPELSIDMTTTGASVTPDVAKRLYRAHKNQVSAVMSVIHGRH